MLNNHHTHSEEKDSNVNISNAATTMVEREVGCMRHISGAILGKMQKFCLTDYHSRTSMAAEMEDGILMINLGFWSRK